LDRPAAVGTISGGDKESDLANWEPGLDNGFLIEDFELGRK
jgi:hypothetical protein